MSRNKSGKKSGWKQKDKMYRLRENQRRQANLFKFRVLRVLMAK